MTQGSNPIQSYYSPDQLVEKITAALIECGRGLDNLTLDDLQPVDEFHIRGLTATLELIKLSGFSADMHILDVGCGVGGSSRRLAQVRGCRVTGIDLSERYIAAARALSDMVGMQDQVRFDVGSALDLPCNDEDFDGIWSIQMNMNIHDKATWLKELYRVLRPGGRLVLYEVCAGPDSPVYFPVPWAQDASMSCLIPPSAFRDELVSAGFAIDHWQDKTDLAYAAFAQVAEPIGTPELPELGVHLLVGEDILTKAYNLRRNLEAQRVSLIEAVAVKTR